MHQVMRTSSPEINYMTERTNNCIEEIKEIRKDGVELFFTVDAGPQVKIVWLYSSFSTFKITNPPSNDLGADPEPSMEASTN